MRVLISFIMAISIFSTSLGYSNYRINSFSCDYVTEISLSECLALVALFNSTDGPSWKTNTNWLSNYSPSTWFGVSIEAKSVSSLQLNNNQLSGTIPAELGSLSNLNILYLSSNQLSGPIPPSLGNLTLLMDLYLDNNQLTGFIPPELGNLSNLWHLDLSWNRLNGQIPPELGKLRVWLFDLSANQLSGSIPSELGALPMVVEFQIQGNQLTGTIPGELGNLNYVQRLNLSYNQLTGAIPPQLGNLQNLTGLYLYNNKLSGTIPPEIGNLTNLEILELSSNQLNGPIPNELGTLPSLVSLNLNWNPLNSPFPLMVTNISTLRFLYLGYTQISGLIPVEISNLTNLEELDMQSNQLFGDIPPKLVDLINLSYLNLGYNHLKVPANPQILADFLNSKDPDWYKTQAFDQIVEGGTEATVTALDGLTIIHISSASLNTSATFTFEPQLKPNEDTGNLTFAGNSFLLSAINNLGDPVTIFSQPLVVDVFYDEGSIGNIPEKKLALFYWDIDENKWLDVVTTCDGGEYVRNLELNTFSVQLCHLSEFSLMGLPNFNVFLPLISQ